MSAMFCPSCRSEFRPGFSRCNDCDVDLVWELPKDAHADPRLVSVFESSDPSLVAVVQSLLDDADIPYEIRNPRAHGVLGTDGFSMNPTRFFVRGDDAEEARELLADLVRYDDAQGQE